MKSASTSAITTQIRDDILGARTRTKPVCFVEYLDDDGAWKELLHLTRCSLQTDAVKSTFGEVSYIPPASSFSAELVNLREIYTPESGNELDHVLRNEREVRVALGYDLEDSTGYLLTEDGDTLTSEAGDAFVVESSELIDMGHFFIEDPQISNRYGENSISISGRDAFKRAMETSISLPTYTSTDVGQILREALSLSGIQTSSVLIPDLGKTITVSDVSGLTNTLASGILNQLMSYINAIVGDYRLFINADGNAQLSSVPTDYTAFDYEMDYFSHLISSSYSYRKNQNVQRCDVFRKEHTANAATTLATSTRTSTGSVTLSWGNPSVYLSLDVDFGESDESVDLIVDQVNQTSIAISITGSGLVDIGITVTGCELQSSPPYFGSAISWGLHKSKNGITKKIINAFVQSDAEARQIAEKVVEDYGVFNPMVAEFSVPGNPLLEPNDRVMVTDFNATKKNLYSVESLSHGYEAEGESFTSSVRMRYSGVSVIAQTGDLLAEDGDNLTTEISQQLNIE